MCARCQSMPVCPHCLSPLLWDTITRVPHTALVPIGLDLKEQLDNFVADIDLRMPHCMASVNRFDVVAHCWWCPGRGDGGPCMRPCQRAAAREIQDLVVAVHMLERGWVSTDPALVPVPDALIKSRYIQSYGKVVRNVLHMSFGGKHKKRPVSSNSLSIFVTITTSS